MNIETSLVPAKAVSATSREAGNQWNSAPLSLLEEEHCAGFTLSVHFQSCGNTNKQSGIKDGGINAPQASWEELPHLQQQHQSLEQLHPLHELCP